MKKNNFFSICTVIYCVAIVNVISASDFETFQTENSYDVLHRRSKIKMFEKQMDEFISEQMGENNGTGLSIVVVNGNSIIYEKGFGYADKENNIPVDSSTLFHIGSITKLFTGIGIMQLAQKDLIDIDAPIQQYIPEFSIKYHKYSRRPITIRSIMSHQSGIFGDKEANNSGSTYPAEDFRTFPEFAKNEYAAYRPNYITSYSNFAVSLLGIIIERVANQQYEQYVYDNILKPCGMLESGFDPKKEHETLLAKGYKKDGRLFPYYYSSGNPAGFLASNSNNMAKFIKMILNRGYYDENWILYPHTLKYMYRPQSNYVTMNLYEDYTSLYNFSLSWMLENKSFDYMGTVVGHGGNIRPYNSKLLIAKDQNIGVFVTANTEDFYPDAISYYALEKAGKIFRHLEKPDLPAVPHIITLPECYKQFYTGTYCILRWNPIEIYSENDTLYFQELHTQPIPLVYHADGWFSFVINNTVMPGDRFTIKRIGGRKVLCAESRDTYSIHRMIYGNAFVPKEIPSDEIENLTGLYLDAASGYPALSISTDTLSQSKETFLTATRFDFNHLYILNPTKDNSLIIQGLGRGGQQTAYFTNDTLNYSGFKLIKTSDLEPKTNREFPESNLQSAKASKTSKLKSALEVFNDFKKLIEKEKNL